MGEPLEEPFCHHNTCSSTCFLIPGLSSTLLSLARVRGSQPASVEGGISPAAFAAPRLGGRVVGAAELDVSEAGGA